MQDSVVIMDGCALRPPPTLSRPLFSLLAIYRSTCSRFRRTKSFEAMSAKYTKAYVPTPTPFWVETYSNFLAMTRCTLVLGPLRVLRQNNFLACSESLARSKVRFRNDIHWFNGQTAHYERAGLGHPAVRHP